MLRKYVNIDFQSKKFMNLRHPRVDPRDFRAFCFRGAGRANFVISAERRSDGLRIVWRLSKARKKQIVTHKETSVLINRYMENIISPFFDPEFLVAPKIVAFSVEDLHHLAKVPSLESNVFIENFSDLRHIPQEKSFLPTGFVPHNVTQIPVLEMLDATQIPHLPRELTNSSTITVEIKPKQGFMQSHPGLNLPYCQNCVLQLEKCSSSHFEDMYEFCPLDLFSGNEERTSRALRELFRNPHRNLRIFLDGNLVHANEILCDYHNLDRELFRNGEGTSEDLVMALSYILTGSQNVENFSLQKDSVLGQILEGQKKDPVGIVRAFEIYKKLPTHVQDELKNKEKLPVSNLDVLEKNDYRSLIESYLFSATMKDCSIMASLQLRPNGASDETHCIQVPSGATFAYSIKVVDLDPKSPKNLINGYQRFMAGAKIIKIEKPPIPPCC